MTYMCDDDLYEKSLRSVMMTYMRKVLVSCRVWQSSPSPSSLPLQRRALTLFIDNHWDDDGDNDDEADDDDGDDDNDDYGDHNETISKTEQKNAFGRVKTNIPDSSVDIVMMISKLISVYQF